MHDDPSTDSAIGSRTDASNRRSTGKPLVRNTHIRTQGAQTTPDALSIHQVTFIRAGVQILANVNLDVRAGQNWVILGPNGAGKSTLLNLCAAETFPSRGQIQVLGHRLGEIDLRELRQSIGFVNPRHALRSNLGAEELLLTGLTATIELLPRWQPTEIERDRARQLMYKLGLTDGLHWHTMSQGERGRALIGRALMHDPALLLLDEPSTGLDVSAREQMISTLAALPQTIPGITTVMVTHHFEEIPPTTSHAALMRGGEITAAGPVEDVLTSQNVSATFAYQLDVSSNAGRWQISSSSQ